MSSMGFTLSTHFCGGHAVESALAIGDTNLDCGMMDAMQKPVDHENSNTIVSESACCSNEYSEYNIEDDYSAGLTSVDVNNTFLFAFAYTYLSPDLNEIDHNRPYIYYDYPPLITDIHVLNQSFLI
jgi:hypothetical protein